MTIQLHELECGRNHEFATGALSRESGGIIILSCKKDTYSYIDPELEDYQDLVVGDLGEWFVALGDESHTLLVGDKYATIPLVKGGVVVRIRFEDWDGGYGRVKFFWIDDGSCLVETESGFWRFSRSSGIVWSVAHRDLYCHVEKVQQNKVFTYDNNEDVLSQYLVTDGSLLKRIPNET